MLGESAPLSLQHEVKTRQATWGAFTLYLGLERAYLPTDMPDHHQVVVDPEQPLGEGNSVFISLSDPTDPARAPVGMRAATLSTHTAITPWLALRKSNKAAYEACKAQYTERLLAAAERALPGLRGAIRLNLQGTPATFEFFTRRPSGMVGGFPQTSLFNVRGPQTGLPNVWLVGDSIFPGQSTAGVTLGAMRVATEILRADPRRV
jgi:phytoene dehydrogenase-like protein